MSSRRSFIQNLIGAGIATGAGVKSGDIELTGDVDGGNQETVASGFPTESDVLQGTEYGWLNGAATACIVIKTNK